MSASQQGERSKESLRSVLLGAAFLMATSAIGPGFLTQTAVFTEQLGASFAFAILISVIFDLGAQLTIWRVIAAANARAQDVANAVAPGLGHFLAALVAIGGFAFNIGNVAGAGLGMQAMFDIPVAVGAAASAVIAIGLFLVKEAGRAMDRFAQALGFLMIALTLYVAVVSRPPIGEAIVRAVAPVHMAVLPIVTIVGGTVGGYITFAGAHRLLDAGVSGTGAIGKVTSSAATAIGVASLMRVLLFLAALGIVSHGAHLGKDNPAAELFRIPAGQIGYRLFGIVMWAAAITSVVGASYTSVSFMRSLSAAVDRRWNLVVIGFIALSAIVFLLIGRPVKVLIAVGAANAMILPIGLGAMLVAAYRPGIVGEYRHPPLLTALALMVATAMAGMGAYTIVNELPKMWR